LKLTTQEAVLAALQTWAADKGMSWDADHNLPEPRCGSCGLPINIWDGEDACRACDDCESCCWDNHGGEPHAVPGTCRGPCTMALMPGEACEACGAVARDSWLILGTNKDDDLKAAPLPEVAEASEWAEDEGFEVWTVRGLEEARAYAFRILALVRQARQA
jgi:hypothetical protein